MGSDVYPYRSAWVSASGCGMDHRTANVYTHVNVFKERDSQTMLRESKEQQQTYCRKVLNCCKITKEFLARDNFHEYVWGTTQLLLVLFIGFACSLLTENETNGAVLVALFVLVAASVLFSITGSAILFSKLRSQFTFGVFVGASACLASEMVLISIVTGHNLAKTHTKDDIPNPTENGVSTLAFLLSITYIVVATFMWLKREKIIKSWNLKSSRPKHLADGEFDEIQLV